MKGRKIFRPGLFPVNYRTRRKIDLLIFLNSKIQKEINIIKISLDKCTWRAPKLLFKTLAKIKRVFKTHHD
tara:strand:+ start:477 stop:689 length:213 start_codon:yes stop_codon:yes gene_type:complete